MPTINAYDSELIEIYNMSSSSRDGMSGALNYSVLLDIAKSTGLDDFEDLLFLARNIESELSKKRDAAKK
jgi:hypothetical protein